MLEFSVTNLVPFKGQGIKEKSAKCLTVYRRKYKIISIPKIHLNISLIVGLPYICKGFSFVIVSHSVHKH
jgi:hypothetical protein